MSLPIELDTSVAPEVRTTAGVVRGRWRPTAGAASAAFFGIPFAEAPVGELRFAAPVPHAKVRPTPRSHTATANSRGPS